MIPSTNWIPELDQFTFWCSHRSCIMRSRHELRQLFADEQHRAQQRRLAFEAATASPPDWKTFRDIMASGIFLASQCTLHLDRPRIGVALQSIGISQDCQHGYWLIPPVPKSNSAYLWSDFTGRLKYVPPSLGVLRKFAHVVGEWALMPEHLQLELADAEADFDITFEYVKRFRNDVALKDCAEYEFVLLYTLWPEPLPALKTWYQMHLLVGGRRSDSAFAKLASVRQFAFEERSQLGLQWNSMRDAWEADVSTLVKLASQPCDSPCRVEPTPQLLAEEIIDALQRRDASDWLRKAEAGPAECLSYAALRVDTNATSDDSGSEALDLAKEKDLSFVQIYTYLYSALC